MSRLFFVVLFFNSFSISAQRDSILYGIRCYMVSESKDTGTVWIQQNIKTKHGLVFNGRYFELFANGKLKINGNYKKGARTGKWIGYYETGQKSFVGYYDNGLKSDLWMKYFPHGQLAWKGSFFKDMHAGFWRYYYENGLLKAMTRYLIKSRAVTGKKIAKLNQFSFFPNLTYNYIISPADSLVEYYPDGKLKIRFLYGQSGGLNGICNSYYSTGKENFSGAYTNGQKSGLWNYYCSDGIIYQNIQFNTKTLPLISNTDSNAELHCLYLEILPEIKWEKEFYPSTN